MLLDDETDDFPVTQLSVAAAERPAPETRGWPSIFDLAAATAFGYCWSMRLASPRTRPRATPSCLQEQTHLAIEREPGRVLCRRVHYLDTDAWKQQEAERRARQVMPPPPKQHFRLRRSLSR